jgi:hypothetical protein
MYTLGENGEYALSDGALNHIINGDVTERLFDIEGERNAGKLTILKGGLHTVAGWLEFKKMHPSLKHLYHYDSKAEPFWYYARELQNGVVCLKLPKELFQSKAANITMFPDKFYKSGYLWKTLFPECFSTEKIIEVINEALHNLDKEESNENQLIGYALCAEPMTAMRIVIQVRDKGIQSAFPAWTQPSTGNNGKPYAHADSIGYNLSASTLFFDDDKTKPNIENSKIFKQEEGLFSIVNNTPKVLLSRASPCTDEDKDKWKNRRRLDLMNHAGSLTDFQLSKVINYVTDVAICKYNYEIMQNAYEEVLPEINASEEVRNAFSFTQNILDSIDILFFADQFKQLNNLSVAVSYLLLNQFTTTGGLDSLNKKRIHRKILDCVSMHHDESTIKKYITDLSLSPVRKELYQEFNLNSYFKKSLDVMSDEFMFHMSPITYPNLSFPLTKAHLMGYIKNQLPLNYHVHFSDVEKNKIVDDILKSYGTNSEELISDNLIYSNCGEFEFISSDFDALINKIIEKSISFEGNSINTIVRDYCRIQYTQRLNLAFIFSEEFSYDIDYMNHQDEFYMRQMIAKHERWWLTTNLRMFLDAALKYANHCNNNAFVKDIEAFKEAISKEQPPFLNIIPEYINSWQHHANKEEKVLSDVISIG